MASIFTKIINGDLPASFVYRDELCVVFMDLHPLGEGHLLVVPIEEKDRLADLPAETAGHLFKVAQKILKALDKTSLAGEGYNLFLSDGEVAGQEVPHCHLHILPRKSSDKIRVTFGVRPTQAERERLDEISSEIAGNLS